MAPQDAFALSNSPFNPFLYAEVGIEENGSGLTVLSLLARLGEDPWSAAARWSALPKAGIIEQLLAGMAQMPLGAEARAEARATASRLVLLLPGRPGRPSIEAEPGGGRLPTWLPMAAFYCAMAIGLVLNGLVASHADDTAHSTHVTTSVAAK